MLSNKNIRQGKFLFKYRGVVPVILLVIGLGVKYLNNPFLRIPNHIWLWLIIALIGLIIRAYTVGYSPKNTSGRNTGRQLANQLNQTGSYAIVRHPLYLGNFLIWMAIALSSGDLAFVALFLVFFKVFYQKIIGVEEDFLIRSYGEQYVQWKKKTPSFVPKLTLFTKPPLPYNWKKVIRKEKNGIAALFIVFFLMAIVEDLPHKQNLLDLLSDNLIWVFNASVFTGYYLAIKIITKKTTWLA